jgi:hypothetical protein
MKISKIDKVMAIIIVSVVLFTFAVINVHADSYRNYNNYGQPIEQTTVNNYSNDACSLSAVAGASGQHNYDSGESFKWSSSGSYLMGECDNSAVSFGVKKEFGDVNGSINYSTDFDNSMISINANGSF